ncbi:hypothetical protein NL676_006044 [Syzygium grande]|nr:hypothetical protein NL676_006044 [Syzygium grande]
MSIGTSFKNHEANAKTIGSRGRDATGHYARSEDRRRDGDESEKLRRRKAGGFAGGACGRSLAVAGGLLDPAMGPGPTGTRPDPVRSPPCELHVASHVPQWTWLCTGMSIARGGGESLKGEDGGAGGGASPEQEEVGKLGSRPPAAMVTKDGWVRTPMAEDGMVAEHT